MPEKPNADLIKNLIDRAIEAGRDGSLTLGDIFDELDPLLGTEGKDTKVRDFFAGWADAVNHDYQVYKIRDRGEWMAAAQELREWYFNDEGELSSRALWEEVF